MNLEGILKILRDTGVEEKEAQVTPTNADIRLCCPAARWTHKNGTDRHPSFNIRLSPDGNSTWTCFACKIHGRSMRHFVWMMEHFKGVEFEAARLLASTERTPVFPLDEMKSKGGALLPERVLPEMVLEQYRGSVPRYVLNRGITLDTCRKWELGWDAAEGRVVIPVRRWDGALVALGGRAVQPDVYPKFKTYHGAQKARYFYGEHMIRRNQEAIVLVEGYFDTLWLSQFDVQSLALMGTHLSLEQRGKLAEFGLPVIAWFDPDQAGRGATAQVVKLMRGIVPVYVASSLPGRGDPDEHTPREITAVLVSSKRAA